VGYNYCCSQINKIFKYNFRTLENNFWCSQIHNISVKFDFRTMENNYCCSSTNNILFECSVVTHQHHIRRRTTIKQYDWGRFFNNIVIDSWQTWCLGTYNYLYTCTRSDLQLYNKHHEHFAYYNISKIKVNNFYVRIRCI